VARDLTQDTRDAATASVVRPIVFVQFEFASETTRVWSGVGSIDWNGETWSGLGELGKISPVEETTDLRIAGMIYELSGVAPDLIAVSMDKGEYRRRRDCAWIGFTTDDMRTVVVDPYQFWDGRLDKMTVQDGPTATIQVSSEHHLADLERSRARRYTDADQKAAYPDDKGLEFIEAIQDQTLEWPNGAA